MKYLKKVGVWMDYSMAHIMEFSEKPFEIKTIESKFLSNEKGNGLAKMEKHLQSKERQFKIDFFKQIANVLLAYDKVLLFGPTNAKTEFYNLLNQDHRFLKIKIYKKETSKMTMNQRNQFIHDHFTSPLYK
jgi:stalled ribosome rescue protein Dom34